MKTKKHLSKFQADSDEDYRDQFDDEPEAEADTYEAEFPIEPDPADCDEGNYYDR